MVSEISFAYRRFEHKINISLPDVLQRKSLIKNQLINTDNILNENHYHQLTNLTQGYSAIEIVTLCIEARLRPIRESNSSDNETSSNNKIRNCNQNNTSSITISFQNIPEINNSPQLRQVNIDDFISCMSEIKPNVTSSDISNYEEFKIELNN